MKGFITAPLDTTVFSVLTPRSSSFGLRFLFFPICFQQVKNRKLATFCLSQFLQVELQEYTAGFSLNCAAGITCCKNCASLRSSGTQNVTKKWPNPAVSTIVTRNYRALLVTKAPGTNFLNLYLTQFQ